LRKRNFYYNIHHPLEKTIHYSNPFETAQTAETAQSSKKVSTGFSTFEIFFREKLTYLDMLAAMGCDEKTRQKVMDFFSLILT
jgi:hypothetical protein